jgi:hypothetical protein
MDLSVKFKAFSSDGQAKISAASAGCDGGRLSAVPGVFPDG